MQGTWGTIRVFVSSTFRDMQAERDHLVRFVFPQLREDLLQRRIHLVDVDLRWGVTSDQDASEVCREIVDECRPRFLCMLGGRYGWVPPGKNRSITADEVHYGVLDRIGQHGYAFFYFRDPAATAAMAEEQVGEFRERPGSPDERNLVELKEAIGKLGLGPFTYPADWDQQNRRLVGLTEFGQRVHADLLASIDAEFGTQAAAKLDEFAEENAAMEAFAEERSQRFVLGSRETVWNELLRHAEGTGGNGSLCLIGEPGSGKSALLAKFGQALQDQTSSLSISHFVGASPNSTDGRRTLRRLCHELVQGAGLSEEIPDDPEKLLTAFSGILNQASTRTRVVLLLDAVNQLDPGSSDLSWLPEKLPDNTRIILTTLPGAALDQLRRRPIPPGEVTLPPLAAGDAEAIIDEFLKRYRKSVTPEQRAMLRVKTDAVTPLYLLAALEELRTLGSYEEITSRIRELPETTQALFVWILDRLEDDPGFRDAKGRLVGAKLVGGFSAYLAASQHGLSHSELVDLLDRGDPQGNVAALLRLLRPYLMRRGEQLDFYHGQFRLAAEKRWLPTPGARASAHRKLAILFLKLADPSGKRQWLGTKGRPFEEIIPHLRAAGHRRTSARVMRHLRYLDARCVLTGPAGILDEFVALEKAGDREAGAWCDFWRARLSHLRSLPDALPALAWHEGSPSVRQAAEAYLHSGPPRRPWLKLDTLPRVNVGVEREEPATFGVHASCPLTASAAAIAGQRGCGFFLEHLGRIRVVDVREGRLLEARIEIPRSRLLAMTATDDGGWLAAVNDKGEGTLLELRWSDDNSSVFVTGRESFVCRLPELEPPAVSFAQGWMWWQAPDGALSSRSLSPAALWRTTPFARSSAAEVRGVFAVAGHVAALVAESSSARLLIVDESGRLGGERTIAGRVSGASILTGGRLLLLRTGGPTLICGGADLSVVTTLTLPRPMVLAVAACGGVLFQSLEPRFYFWTGQAGAEVTTVSTFPIGAGEMRAIAGHAEEVFVIFRGAAVYVRGGSHEAAPVEIRAVMPAGTGYHAVVTTSDGAYLASTTPSQAHRLDDSALGQIEAVANSSEMLWMDAGAKLCLWSPPSPRLTPIGRKPPATRAVVAGPQGLFFVADPFGGLFALGRGYGLMQFGEVPVDHPSRQRLIAGEHWLFWTGLGRGQARETSGVDNLEILVVYRQLGEAGSLRLELAGQRSFPPSDGLWTLSIWDGSRGRLACFFQTGGGQSQTVRVGTPEDFLAAREECHSLALSAANLCAALPIENGAVWLAYSSNGGLLALEPERFGQLAAFIGTKRCSGLASGDGPGSSALAIEAHREVVQCTLQTTQM